MVQPARRLVCVLLLIAMIGAASLTSPPPPRGQGDGDPAGQPRADRSANPILAAFAGFFAIGYATPTQPATQIKALFLRGGATLIAVVALVAWGLSVRRPTRSGPRRARHDALAMEERESLLVGNGDRTSGALFGWRRPGLLGLAMLLAVGWLAWSAAASFWSHSRPTSALFAQSFAFVVALAAVSAAVLDRVHRAAIVWLAVAAALAVMAALARFGAAQPVAIFTDNPNELAGLLLAAGVLAIVKLTGRLAERLFPDDVAGQTRSWSGRLMSSGYLVAAAAIVIGIFACGPSAWRIGLLAGAAGLAAAAILLTRQRWRVGWSLVAIVLLPLLTWLVIFCQPAAQPFDADADSRAAQIDRWSLAWELVGDRPVVGHGPWSARLLANRVAEQRALSDLRWANHSIESIESFWLEQLADVGVVGVLLLAGSLAMIVAAASRAVRQCPYRRQRYLIAGLAGGLIAMAVHELFASALARPGFAAVLAGWVGLTAAASRAGGQAQQNAAGKPDCIDPFVIGFYRGTVFLLAGAAVILSSVGYLVVKDFSSARTHYVAIHENLPRAAEPATLLDVVNRQAIARDQEFVEAIARLDDAAAWSFDYENRLTAGRQRAYVASAHVAMQINEQLARGAVGARTPAPMGISAGWAETLVESMARLQSVEAIRPAGQPRLAESLAEQCLLLARGRWLSLESEPVSRLAREQNVLARGDAVRAVRRAADTLDRRLATYPYDLPAALLRLAMADPAGLGRRMLISPTSADWLWGRASLRLSPGQRLRTLRDAIRDCAVIWSEPADQRLIIGPPGWDDIAPEFHAAMVRVELARPTAGEEWNVMLATANIVAQSRRQPGGWWIGSDNADERNAPQTFRLAAEMAMARSFVRNRAGLPMLPGDDDPLAVADRMFEQAQRLYEHDPSRFALQRVMVLLARAQLAWHREQRAGPSSALRAGPSLGSAAMQFADDAEQALSDVTAVQRPSAEHAVATVKAFLLFQAGQREQAAEWLARAQAGRRVDLERFGRELAAGWQEWLSPAKADRPVPASQPDRGGQIDLSPLYPFHWPIGPMR